MNDVMVVSIVIVCAVAINRCVSNDCQLLIVVLRVTPYSSCCNACTVHTAYCWVGAGAIYRDRDIYRMCLPG